MLLDESEDLTPDERVDRAFRYDTIPDKADEVKKNFELFNDYVRGGIDLLYEKFNEGSMIREDYMNKTFDVMTEFKAEIDGIDYSAELEKLLK